MWDVDDVNSMETRTKLGKVVEDFDVCGVYIERVWVLDILLPRLVDKVHGYFFSLCVGLVIEGMVVPLGLVLPLYLMYLVPCRILVD